MPIQLKYSNINDELFVRALAKLAKYEAFRDQKLAYNIAKLIRRFDSETKMAQELYLKLIKQYAVLDEAGQIKAPENQEGAFEIPKDKQEDWKKARQDFDSVDFEVDCHKIRLDQLTGVPLSPMDLNVLEPILSELELVPNPVEDQSANA